MGYGLSVCCFIRDTFEGAFCIFESLASLLPFADEYIVRDLGSTDGTLETLQEIAVGNPKVKIQQGNFPVVDAGAFATLANDLIASCQHDSVLYHQADEIWHEDLLDLMRRKFDAGQFDLSFWRIQYRDNFQRVKWFPHLVHRVGVKGNFNFADDGMTTDRTWDAKICSDYGGEFFMRWGMMHQDGIKPYVNQMITDVSLIGGFRDNVVRRRALHAPFWHEEPTVEGKPADQWQREAEANPDWARPTSPYNLPAILRWHVGHTLYLLRKDLLDAICQDRTWQYIQDLKGQR